jgi:NADPH:quinone reductase-like Zn-dependent oxidoreductase
MRKSISQLPAPALAGVVRAKNEREAIAELVEKVWPRIEDGSIKPLIYKVLPITQAEQAHDILQRCENVGKVVLQVV